MTGFQVFKMSSAISIVKVTSLLKQSLRIYLGYFLSSLIIVVYFAQPLTSKTLPNLSVKSTTIAQVFSSDPELNQLLIQGMEKGIQGNYQGAIADFSEVIRRNPNELEAYYNRGIAYAQITEYQKAIADFDRAISLNPKSAEAYLEKAKIYYQLGNYSQTRTDLQTAIQLFQQHNNASGYQEAQDLLNQL